MPYPHLRSGESRTPTETQVGVLVIAADGRRFLFPGGASFENGRASYEIPLSLARQVLINGELDHPETSIEFGEAIGKEWVPIAIIKAPPKKETESTAGPG